MSAYLSRMYQTRRLFAVNLLHRQFLGGTPWKGKERAFKDVVVTLLNIRNAKSPQSLFGNDRLTERDTSIIGRDRLMTKNLETSAR